MVTTSANAELIKQLQLVEGKAEIVNGRIVRMSPASDWHGRAGLRIATSLLYYSDIHGGIAQGDGTGFLADLPNRGSFTPDAAYYTGPPGEMKLCPEAPDFAVEIRSIDDYGPAAETRLAEKRADYFAAGTKVVWDVDIHRENLVRVHRSTDPENPTTYRLGDVAEAEPAVPGWTIKVSDFIRK